jgi:glycosyltransferase involved in cell wall biosynthesis
LLESLSDFSSRGGEIVIVDTGSVDNTVDIAKAGGCKVFEVGDRFQVTMDEDTAKAINDKFVVPPDKPIIKAGDKFFKFADARNYAMTLASNDFLCTPDSDEAWTVLNIDKLNELIEAGWEKMLVNFAFAHFEDGTPSVKFAFDRPLQDRRKTEWTGIIHETMKGDAKTIAIGEDVAYLEHWQNQDTDRSRYLAGLGWACYLEPRNDRNSHYFARELMYRGHTHSAIKEFLRHIDMNQWDLERSQSMVFLGNCYETLGRDEKAMEWWHKSFSIGCRREGLLRLAGYWMRKDSPARVAAYAAASMEVPNNGFYANDVCNYTFTPHEFMYWAKGWLGDIPAAREHLLRCLNYHPSKQKYLDDMQYYFSKEERELALAHAGREYPFVNDIPGWMTVKELAVLYKLAQSVDSVIEIGSWKGRSTKALLEGCKGTVTAIDHFQGSPGEGNAHDEAKVSDLSIDFLKNVGHFPNIRLLKMSNGEAAEKYPDLRADMVFIDGSHVYEDVVKDIKTWLPRTNKILCGHDYGQWDIARAVKEQLGDVVVLESIWIKQL